jgi:hypothetical protein
MNIFNQNTELDDINKNMKKNAYFINKKMSIEKTIKDEYNIDKIEWIKNDNMEIENLYLDNIVYDDNLYKKLNQIEIFKIPINLKNKEYSYYSRYRVHYDKNIYYMILGSIKYLYGNDKSYIKIPFIKSSPEFEKIILNNPNILNKISEYNICVTCDFDSFNFESYIRCSELYYDKMNNEIENIKFRNVEYKCSLYVLLSSNILIGNNFRDEMDQKIEKSNNLVSNIEIILKDKNIEIKLDYLTEFVRKIIIQYSYVKDYSNNDTLINVIL